MNPKRKKHLYTFWRLPAISNRLNRAEVQDIINSLNPKKSSGYDLITGKILKENIVPSYSMLSYSKGTSGHNGKSHRLSSSSSS
jgi:hypothetical protein